MQPGWCQPIRQEFMENECEALRGVAYPGVRDNRSTINTKTGYDDDEVPLPLTLVVSVAVAVLLASWGTTAATRVPRLRIGEHSREWTRG